MVTPGQIAHVLRLHADRLDGRHIRGTLTHDLCRSVRRGAAEIERLEAELVWLRGFAEDVLAAQERALEGAA